MYNNDRPQGEKKEIKCEVLESLRTTGQVGKKWTVLRIVRWNDRWVNLEKREFYTDRESGDERMGKAKGFDIADVLYICENQKKILGIINDGQSNSQGGR